MNKIPTVFERDWDGDRSRVLNKVHPGCEWVLAGEGVATQKLDGACAMVRDHRLYKKREVKKGTQVPTEFELVEADPITGDSVGWVPVGEGPGDRWFRDALENDAWVKGYVSGKPIDAMSDGTYELVGPKVRGNPEGLDRHLLWKHEDSIKFIDVPRDYEGLKGWLTGRNIEGLVFHHPDGRMAKIKLRDFGLKRANK